MGQPATGCRRSLARLDRCYAFRQVGAGEEPVKEYFIKGDCCISDHLPVVCTVMLQVGVRKKSAFKMSGQFLKDPAVVLQVGRIWNSNPRLSFTGKLRKVVRFYKGFCIDKAKAFRAEEVGLRKVVDALTTSLHANPADEAIQGRLGEAGDSLKSHERRQAEGQRIRSRVKWRCVGDSCSADFFRAAKAHSGASSITELEDATGAVHTDQPAVERICSEYYSSLYKAEIPSQARTLATEQALSSIRDRLSPLMKQAL